MNMIEKMTKMINLHKFLLTGAISLRIHSPSASVG
jgi:hypothetical protein